MIDRTNAERFLNKIVKIETDSDNFNYFKGRVLEVTNAGIVLESMMGKIAAISLEEISTIREAE